MTATWTVGLDAVDISLVDVHPGHERAFHDWYESDHFYAGGVLAPGVLSGRKWYAPAALRAARYLAVDSPFPDRDAGTNLATYFQNEGSGYETFQAWVMPQLVELRAAGRMFTERTPVNIGFWTFDGVVDAATCSSVPPLVALEHPFAAAVLGVRDVGWSGRSVRRRRAARDAGAAPVAQARQCPERQSGRPVRDWPGGAAVGVPGRAGATIRCRGHGRARARDRRRSRASPAVGRRLPARRTRRSVVRRHHPTNPRLTPEEHHHDRRDR